MFFHSIQKKKKNLSLLFAWIVGINEVPNFVVYEFSYYLKKGDEVEAVCPFCHGTIRQA